jgi:hypothetical protein
MKRAAAVFLGIAALGIAALGLAGCAGAVPAPTYAQSRAIDQDIDATHAGIPSLGAPVAGSESNVFTPVPWRNEEEVDRQKAEQTGQLPQ